MMLRFLFVVLIATAAIACELIPAQGMVAQTVSMVITVDSESQSVNSEKVCDIISDAYDDTFTGVEGIGEKRITCGFLPLIPDQTEEYKLTLRAEFKDENQYTKAACAWYEPDVCSPIKDAVRGYYPSATFRNINVGMDETDVEPDFSSSTSVIASTTIAIAMMVAMLG